MRPDKGAAAAVRRLTMMMRPINHRFTGGRRSAVARGEQTVAGQQLAARSSQLTTKSTL